MEAHATTVGSRPGQDSRQDVAGGSATLADAAGLTAAAVLGAASALASAAYLLLPAIELPEPFEDHHQTAETAVFLITLVIVLPLAVWTVPRLADRIASRSRTAAAGAAALVCATLVAGLVLVRVSTALPWGGGMPTLLAVTAMWWIGVGAVVARALVAADVGLLERVGARAGDVWGAAAVLAVGVIAAFAIWASVSAPVLAAAIAIAAAGLFAIRRFELPAPTRFGWVVDLAMVGLLLLAVPNLVVLRPDVDAESFLTLTIDMHQNFFVAPASDLLAGGTLLVDTFSQYGVVSIAFIAGWFDIVGVGNGTLGLLEGLMSALVFAAGYLVVRASGAGRALAVTGFAVATVVLVFGLVYPVGGLLQHGAIRFGMPMAILAAAAVELRFERFAAPARVLAFATVGLSSVWALEAFGYTAFTFAAIVAAGAALEPAGGRLRYASRRAVAALAACIAAHLILAAVTLAISGSLPDWAVYLSTLREFLGGRIGELTYDFSAWSPGLAVGALYAVSAVGVALIVLRRRDLALGERAAVVLLAGSTAYGVALFSYLVNRSADHIVPYVSLPAFMVVMIWLGLLGRTAGAGARPVRVLLALSLAASALMVAVASSSVDLRLSQSALAHVVPGGQSTRAALARLRHMPQISPGADEAELLLDSYWAGSSRALVITEPDRGIEALAQTGRRNLLPLTNPLESSFVPVQSLERLDEALAAIEPGELMLTDENALRTFAQLQRNPDRMPRTGSELDPLSPQALRFVAPGGLAVLQKYALGRLGERFDAEVVARSEGGLLVVELVPR